MNPKFRNILLFTLQPLLVLAQTTAIYQSNAYSIFSNKVVQSNQVANVVSATEINSNYQSPQAANYSPDIQFKFSINSRDNEMDSGKDHHITLHPINGKSKTTVVFGEQLLQTDATQALLNLPENTVWTIQVDLRKMINAFETNGFYTLSNGEKLTKSDFKGVYVAGNAAPLSWDFSNLYTKPELELKDPDGDGIYETTLLMNNKENVKHTNGQWKLSKNTSAFPQYSSNFPIADAIYNLSTEEMINAVEPDSTFRTGKEWAGVWTRDISYSIILSMAYLQPQVAKYSLLRKVKNNRIIQDTGTGGAYPVSTDRIIWAVAAWELYKATGDADWLKQAYGIIKNSIEDDMLNAYDSQTGLVKGESSFLDWREQTYPRWMQPADIFESECLGTNAAHYQANIVLSEMASLLNEPTVAVKHRQIAQRIKNGINQYLWVADKGYYGQYLYGRNFKTLSPRSEALGEALCVLFGISSPSQQQSVVAKVPVTDYGIPCIYPQIPNIPPYHNNGVWPFVQAYWALASAKAANENSLLESMAAIYRPAALFLTNKENLVADNGDFAGTQINSSNMLWSLSGSLALVHRVLFGIEFQKDGLRFSPSVPKAFDGKRSLTNFKYRNANLDIYMEGFGNEILRFELDGKVAQPLIVSSLTGKHSIKISLANRTFSTETINKRSNYTTVETPVVIFKAGILAWNKIKDAISYLVIKNGKKLTQTTQTQLKVNSNEYAEYQVVAVDSKNVSSFASEPCVVSAQPQTFNLAKFVTQSDTNSNVKDAIEISNTQNKLISIPVNIKKTGTYAFNFSYSNGNGPVNTENKCAIRTLKVDGKFAGTIVLPQRGKNEWTNWGNTNSVQALLKKGKHTISLVYENQNQNMNGTVNQANINVMNIFQLY